MSEGESEFQRLREIPDPFDRAKAVLDAQDSHRQAISTLSAMRREILSEIRSSGLRPAEIAKRIGVTRARMSQLLNASGPEPERAFLGDGRLTVVLGEKPINGNNVIEPGVAIETVGAYHRLKELAETYQLDADDEVIPPPGMFDLNRDNLVVMAGPRLFPMVGQILDGDPHVRFKCDNGEWTLRDLDAGKTYRATPRDDSGMPLSTGETPRDFGYLGRLPRPDGQGTFLCIGGIHDTGTQGVVAFIEANLPQIYSEVKTRRFSMIVECEYNAQRRETTIRREVTTAKPASPIYKRS